ncbi:peptidase M23 [Siminovitchia acidinfaciens]|uniref:Peptidase M23 n=1 Tax=Siminovitchia acidinfaciens TaxID=2321395 RepID=A0A429Y8K0_9BACI|nr:peptidase M23 [Siminovitchia acidinfaciens]
MKRRSLLSITLAGVIGFGGTFSYIGQASASKISDLQSEQNQILNKKSDINKSIGEKNSQITDIDHQVGSIEADVKKIEGEIATTNSKIKEKEQQISDTKSEIESLKAEIKELKIKIKKRNELLKERARNIQTNGGSVDYIDVILGAESFGDLVDRVSAVNTIVGADKEIMEEQQRDKEKLEENQAKVEKKLAEIEGMLKELEGLKAELSSQKAKKKEAVKLLEKEKKHIESEKLSLEEEQQILSGQAAAIEEAIKMEKEKIAAAEKAEAERKAREAAEAAKAAKAQQSSKPASTSGSTTSKSTATQSSSQQSTSRPSVSAPPVSSGMFTRPAAGYFSSGFGGRSGGYHYGLDIAAGGKVPIVAAADGVVNQSYFSSSYGNVIFIVHSINGKTYETVYAHLSSRSVSAGTRVSKGQFIGYMGNTGQSYGQHLHFEIHEGRWNGSKSNAVDPRRYIN